MLSVYTGPLCAHRDTSPSIDILHKQISLHFCRGISAAPGAGPSRLGSGVAAGHSDAGIAAGGGTPAAVTPGEATLRPWAEEAAASGTRGGRSRGDSFTLDPTPQQRPADVSQVSGDPTAAAIEAVARLASGGTAFGTNAAGGAADTQPQPSGRQQEAEQAAGSWTEAKQQPATERDSLESLKPSARAPDTLGGPDIGLRKTSPPPSPKAAAPVCSCFLPYDAMNSDPMHSDLPVNRCSQ